MIDFSGLLQEMLTTFSQSVPGFLSAVLIFVVGYIISKLVSRAVKKILIAMKVDALGEKLNEIEIVSKANVEIKLSSIFSKVFYYFILLFFMVAATDVLGMPAISDLVKGIFNLVPNLIVAAIVLIIGILFAEVIRGIVKTACESLGIPSGKMISMVIFYFIVINVLVSALTQAKINTEFLSQNISLVIGGAILAFSIGYGLASKDSVSNFLASQYLGDKVNVGDKLSIDGVEGQVIDIDKSSITLETSNGKAFIPLNHLSSGKVHILD